VTESCGGRGTSARGGGFRSEQDDSGMRPWLVRGGAYICLEVGSARISRRRRAAGGAVALCKRHRSIWPSRARQLVGEKETGGERGWG
jgi:hypothetical protein